MDQDDKPRPEIRLEPHHIQTIVLALGSALLHGDLALERADALATALGIPHTEYDSCRWLSLLDGLPFNPTA